MKNCKVQLILKDFGYPIVILLEREKTEFGNIYYFQLKDNQNEINIALNESEFYTLTSIFNRFAKKTK